MAFDHNRRVCSECGPLYQFDPNLKSEERAQAIETRLAAEAGAREARSRRMAKGPYLHSLPDLRRTIHAPGRARKLLGIRKASCGSVTYIQRFGSALNLTSHFHTLVLDGVYAGPSSDPGPFAPLPPPETEDVARVLAGTARRILRRLERKGITTEDEGSTPPRYEIHREMQQP
jgi:hypothetical protein